MQMEEQGYKVVIVGDQNHPEVRAVVGCTKGAVVVGDESDISKIGSGRLGIVCQTTQSPEFFGKMLSAIARAGFDEMKVVNTLCKEAIKRQQAAVELCRKVDIMFVLGGGRAQIRENWRNCAKNTIIKHFICKTGRNLIKNWFSAVGPQA